MSGQTPLYQWIDTVGTHFPHLSKPQAQVLALWSFGMMLARTIGRTTVAQHLAAYLGVNPQSLEQRLSEWYLPQERKAGHKTGRKRRTLDVHACFVPLLGWALSLWHAEQLALALDATSLADRFVVLSVSLLYRGCAIPVIWCILPQGVPGAWRPVWLRMLREIRPAIPCQMQVIVLADRGLYARWLFGRIVRLGWHPLLRIPRRGTFLPEGESRFVLISSLCPQPGDQFAARGVAYQKPQSRLTCTLLCAWDQDAKEPWLLLTDLAPECADACWYGLRMWIEAGFRLIKSAGWHWDKTRITDPERAQRIWLVMAVGTLWLVAVAHEYDPSIPEGTLPPLPAQASARRRSGTYCRRLSLLQQGLAYLLGALLRGAPLPQARLDPDPWPTNTIPLARSQPALPENIPL